MHGYPLIGIVRTQCDAWVAPAYLPQISLPSWGLGGASPLGEPPSSLGLGGFFGLGLCLCEGPGSLQEGQFKAHIMGMRVPWLYMLDCFSSALPLSCVRVTNKCAMPFTPITTERAATNRLAAI